MLTKVALTSDMKMMYRQILVREEDRQYQHVFWRNCGQSDVQEFQLNTVTYGMASSSFLSQRTIKQLVADEGTPYTNASNALLNHIYVDDIVTGASSEEEAVILYNELVELLRKGGFTPRKWASSSSKVLANIPWTTYRVH